MPVNEILAPYYLKIKYTNAVAEHNLRVYFETDSIVQPGAPASVDDWTVQGSGSPVATQISEVVDILFNRAATLPMAENTLTSIEVWQSAAGANTFLHSNRLPSSPTQGTGVGIAASYGMFVFGSSTRQRFRMTFFEIGTASPQRSAQSAPPLVDDDTLVWYVLRSQVPFATQDGRRLTTIRSLNTGYNRKLARSYGRRLAP